MANNIDNTAAFATAFMKPVPGETIDAIYGRKIADNTGYLFYNRVIGPSLDFHVAPANSSNYNFLGTKYFIKEGVSVGSIHGSIVLRCFSPVTSKLFEGTVYVDGTQVYGTGGTSTNGTVTMTGTFIKSLSHLTNLGMYTLSAKLFCQGGAGNAISYNFDVSSFINPI